MDFLDLIDRNVFLTKVFPDGLNEPVKIGKLCLEVGGRSSINIHVKKKPDIEVKKWGEWGKDYNTIVLVLSGGRVDEIKATNWEKSDYQDIHIKSIEKKYLVSQKGQDWEVEFSTDGFVFQECRVYFDDSTSS
ncbi:Imm50 family immunity protein [Halomonas binhaiensis]|uniref:Uncharacterized protein n=1 Tax=Halomonas binhaiensis TaxID=2562282 RepID=A0A5C1NJZ1_9GAMM|nr:Imm50 family immunity protein [Halomonas binhaiensis]QEM82657.1 hypothetical protein E4T21_14690 [Halomonas binhaiensis]